MSGAFQSSRDYVASNGGVPIAAALIAMTRAAWPDIAVGDIIALIFLRSAWHILAEAIPAWREARPVPPEVMR